MLLYRLPIACWRTDERVDSRVLAAVSECSIGTVSEGLGRWRFTCEPARPLWLLVSVYARAPSLHCAIASSFQGQGGRQECRTSHLLSWMLSCLQSHFLVY